MMEQENKESMTLHECLRKKIFSLGEKIICVFLT